MATANKQRKRQREMQRPTQTQRRGQREKRERKAREKAAYMYDVHVSDVLLLLVRRLPSSQTDDGTGNCQRLSNRRRLRRGGVDREGVDEERSGRHRVTGRQVCHGHRDRLLTVLLQLFLRRLLRRSRKQCRGAGQAERRRRRPR